MKNIILVTTILLSALLNAQVIPTINSKGGAMVLPEGKFKMAIKNISFNRDKMYEGTKEVNNQQGLDASANVTLLGLVYGLSKNFDVKVIVPYKQLSADATLPNTSAGMKFPVKIENKGLGDIVVMGRYKLMSIQENGYALSIGAGVKLPTGSSDEKFEQGPPSNPNMTTPMPTQPGTGSAEYKLELGFSKMLTSNMRIDAHTMYTYRPLAENNYDFGDELSYDLGVSYGVLKSLNLGLEYNGKYNTDTDSGTDPEPVQPFPFKSFSGTVGYVTPQIQWLPFEKPKMHLDLGVSILAHYNVSVYQPLEKQRYIVRIGYLF
ncbi:MAG: transporter [Thiovulaceae bacterium]|nr:transporter [Sulfurimonadaceae bacterium]